MIKIRHSAAVWIGSILILYIGASVLWSPNPGRSLETTIHLVGIFVLLFLGFISLAGLEITQECDWRVVVSLLLAAALLIVEELVYGSPLRAFLGGGSEAFRLNRATVALVVYFPLGLSILPRNLKGYLTGAALTLTTVASVWLSESETAKLALIIILMCLVFSMIAWVRFTFIFGFLAVLSLVFMPMIAKILLKIMPDWTMNATYDGSIGIRAQMWEAYSGLIEAAPLFGHGIESAFSAGETYKHTDIPNHLLGSGHPHNFAVQAWYDLGAIGVGLISILLVLIFRLLRSVPNTHYPAVMATIAAIWTVSLVSHGAWQAWWWSLVGLVAVSWGIVLMPSGHNCARKPNNKLDMR